MKRIFNEGEFRGYSSINLNEARVEINSATHYDAHKTTVFISHKHEDLEDLKGIIGFLQKNYNVKAYIDSKDPTMPEKTSAKTATKIKDRINQCDRFILLATDRAIESKWCNWELGYGDAKKYKDKIALFPMKPASEAPQEYKGNEYMQIYPYIAYYDGTEKYTSGESVKKGYYVRTYNPEESIYYIKPLEEWLGNYQSIF